MRRLIGLYENLDEKQLEKMLEIMFDSILKKMQAKGLINQAEADKLYDRKEELIPNLAKGIASRGFKLDNLGQEQYLKQLFMTVFNTMMVAKNDKLFDKFQKLTPNMDDKKELTPEDLKKLFSPEELKELKDALKQCKHDTAEKLEIITGNKIEKKEEKETSVEESNAQLLGMLNTIIGGGFASLVLVNKGNEYQIPNQTVNPIGQASIDDIDKTTGNDPLGLKAITVANFLQDASIDERNVAGLTEAMEGLQNEMQTLVNNPTPTNKLK